MKRTSSFSTIAVLVVSCVVGMSAAVPVFAHGGGGHSGGGHGGGGRAGGWHGGGGGGWHGGGWHGGGWHHGFGGPIYGYGFGAFADPWPYPYYAYDPYPAPLYGPAPGIVDPLPDAPSSPPVPSAWYFCPGANAYYPYVQTCPGGWQRVEPPPPSAPTQ